MKPQIPWLRVFVEGVVIVGSILLAFGIDAAWDGRGDEQRRQALLRGLSADFSAAQEELDRVTGLYGRILTASGRYLELARSGPPSESLRAVTDSLLSDMLWAPSYDAPLGTIQAVLSTGELDLLRSSELVSELTAFVASVDNLADNEEAGIENLRSELRPYLRPRIRTADLNWTDLVTDDVTYSLPYELDHTDAYLLLPDPELEGIVADRYFTYELLMGNAGAVQGRIHRVLAVLAEELEIGQ